ncbi:ABC transporter permease [Rheinheimera soli]|uniref:Permease n=1 Tax=Rheinheimera soli TaxID=443616 RepID=A0ABU1W370_9GAMM|nr:ABC transporter permease [Rheinheimera soli]MDR7122416.1 putative permease [Rheinheimera soli]
MLTIKDFSTALYGLSKAKGYAATVVVTLAVTLGTLLAAFNLNYTILAAPLPYLDEERLFVSKTPRFRDNVMEFDYASPVPLLQTLYQQDKSTFEDTALLAYSYLAASLRDKADTPKVQLAYTTPGYMRMYQMPLLHGRAFSAEEDQNSNAAVAIISERVWRQHYNADPAMLGKSIQIAANQFTVVGIAADHFVEPRLIGPTRINDIWLPWDFNPSPCTRGLDGRSCMTGWQFLLGKLKSVDDYQRVSQQLTAQLNSQFQDANADRPNPANLSISFEAQPLREKLLGDSSHQTLWLFVGSLVLLCIASVNTLNLVLARAVRQQRNMAIQAALGAQKKHVFMHMFAEMALLLLVALLLALVVAQLEYRVLQQVAEVYLPRVNELQLNLPTLAFAFVVTALLGGAFASLVVRHINYRMLNSQLQSSGKGSGLQISAKVRRLLIISQVTLTAVLLVVCMTVMQQSITELSQDVGFHTKNIYQIDIDETAPVLTQETRIARIQQKKRELAEVRNALAQHPAVNAVSLANFAPANFDGVYAESSWLKTPDDLTNIVTARVTYTDQHFLPLFGIKLLSGRNFTAQDINDNSYVLIVSETFARTTWPDQPAVGQRIGRAEALWEVIGVVSDFKLADQYAATEPLRAYSVRQVGAANTLLYELKPGMTIAKTELNQIMQQVQPQYRAAEVFSLEDNVKRILFAKYLATGVTSGLSLLTLLLAAVGIYGVLSYSVQLRRFELGVRMAIGARPVTILQQLLGENLKPVLAGLALAALLLAALWLGLQQTSLIVELSAGGFALPLLLIVLLTTLTSLLSVWGIIRKPAIYALQGQ